MRIGHGFDVHRLVRGGRLILGGVEIPNSEGLVGNSDADVLVHAVMDSILGALCLGDIGAHFPDKDDTYKDADSLMLLAQVREMMEGRGYQIGNVDATIVAQAPRLASHITAMREKIAAALGCDTDRVNVKATTEEWMGYTGSREGMAAHAVCLLNRQE